MFRIVLFRNIADMKQVWTQILLDVCGPTPKDDVIRIIWISLERQGPEVGGGAKLVPTKGSV